jgi:CRISPR/Cas system CMR-associated protein Cmr5 small subunit
MSVTRHQAWSAAALKRIQARKAGEDPGRYRALCMKMPGLIKQAGLVQALVFMKSREKPVGDAFIADLAEVFGKKELIAEAQRQELAPYLAMTNDLSQIAIWFRRFAQIELGGEDGAEESQS